MHHFPALAHLPPSVVHQVFASLCGTLPPPSGEAPEDRAARDETAMLAVAALDPANAFEALLAAQIVGADFHAKDSLRDAVQPGQDEEKTLRCRAQANMMMRQMQSGLRALLRIQAKREKAEAAMRPAAMNKAGYWFRDASVPAPGASSGDAAPLDASNIIEGETPAETGGAVMRRPGGGLPVGRDGAPSTTERAETLIGGNQRSLSSLYRQHAAAKTE